MKEFYKNLLLSLNEEENDNQENYDNLANIFDQIQNSKSIRNSLITNQNNEYRLDDENSNNFDTDFNNQNVEYNLEQRFIEDNLENPFLVNNKFNRLGNLNRLFLSSERSDLSDSKSSSNNIEFNTDTKIDFLGGLTIWQVTAILIALIMFLALSVFLVRKLNKIVKKMTNTGIITKTSNQLSKSRSGSVRTSYSSDSTNHLLSKNFSFKPNTNKYDLKNHSFHPNKLSLPDFV